MRHIPLVLATGLGLAPGLGLAGPAAAQPTPTYLTALPQALVAQAQTDIADDARKSGKPPTIEVSEALGFAVISFQFTGPLPVRYDLNPGYAWLIGPCKGGSSSTQTPSSPQAPFLASAAPSSVGSFGGLAPPPPRPATIDYSLTIQIREPVRGPSPSVAPNAQALPPWAQSLVGAWANATADGQGVVASVQPILGSDREPGGRGSLLILSVAPFYDLNGAPFSAQVVGTNFRGKTLQTGAQTQVAAPQGKPLTVTGELGGGRWAQGAGLLMIPTTATPANCTDSFGGSQADAGVLAAHGIAAGRPFASPTGAFIRVWPYEP